MINSLIDFLISTLISLPGLVLAFAGHEYAHAKVATLCGDTTPYIQGRVTLDPRAHIDPLGLISLFLIHFGWGKPVMVNPANFKNRRRDSMLVGVAGVAMNCAMAVAGSIILKIFTLVFAHYYESALLFTIGQILMEFIVINLSLMLFNLLPVPPLDGFGLLCDLTNFRKTKAYEFLLYNARYILILLIVFRVPSMILSPIMTKILLFFMQDLLKVPFWYMLF